MSALEKLREAVEFSCGEMRGKGSTFWPEALESALAEVDADREGEAGLYRGAVRVFQALAENDRARLATVNEDYQQSVDAVIEREQDLRAQLAHLTESAGDDSCADCEKRCRVLERVAAENYQDLADQMNEAWGYQPQNTLTVDWPELHAFLESRSTHRPTASLRAQLAVAREVNQSWILDWEAVAEAAGEKPDIMVTSLVGRVSALKALAPDGGEGARVDALMRAVKRQAMTAEDGK